VTTFVSLMWASMAAARTQTDEPGQPATEVGYVTVEYDATGHPHTDSRFYTDRAAAEAVAERRNDAERQPSEPLDRWWVLPVSATDPAAADAAAQAAQLRTRSSTGYIS
jgi:hypothetical protein